MCMSGGFEETYLPLRFRTFNRPPKTPPQHCQYDIYWVPEADNNILFTFDNTSAPRESTCFILAFTAITVTVTHRRFANCTTAEPTPQGAPATNICSPSTHFSAMHHVFSRSVGIQARSNCSPQRIPERWQTGRRRRRNQSAFRCCPWNQNQTGACMLARVLEGRWCFRPRLSVLAFACSYFYPLTLRAIMRTSSAE